MFGRGGHRFDKHGRASRRISNGWGDGERLNRGTPDIFTSCQAGVATRRVASDGNSAAIARSFERDIDDGSKKERDRETRERGRTRIRRDLSAFNGPALVKSCTETLSTTLSKLCQQGLAANSWPGLPSYFEINGDLFTGDDTVCARSTKPPSRRGAAQTVLRGTRLCARDFVEQFVYEGASGRINRQETVAVVVERAAFGERAKAKCLH